MRKLIQPTLSDIFTEGKIPQLAAAYLIDENHNNKYTRLMHSHASELELYYAHKGQGYYIIEGCAYAIREGDMVICNAGVLHGDDPDSTRNLRSYCCAITNVSIKGLPDNWLMDNFVSPIVSCGALSSKVSAIMELIYMLSLDTDALGDVCDSFAISILMLTRQLILSKARHEKRTQKRTADAITKKVKEYLDTHYAKKVTLENIGSSLHIAPSYISHIFKQETGISPIQYVLSRRFGEAQSLLMDTELSVNEISDLLGFATPAHFNAMFKKHVGLTPGQYRISIEKMRTRDETIR